MVVLVARVISTVRRSGSGTGHRGHRAGGFDARACPRFAARACPVRVRVLGVSRVLAVWRCLIYARKVGVYLRYQGEAQSQTPTFYSCTSGALG